METPKTRAQVMNNFTFIAESVAVGDPVWGKRQSDTEGGPEEGPGFYWLPLAKCGDCPSVQRQRLIKSLALCEWQHQSVYCGDFSQHSHFSTIRKSVVRGYERGPGVPSSLFRLLKNMSARPLCLLCLCTLYPEPQEAHRRRGGN